MALRSLLVAAATFGIPGANASPCRPKTVTSVTETLSTAASETTLTSLTTTIPTSLSETTVTSVFETLSEIGFTSLTTSIPATVSETTSTTFAETTTTSEGPACVEIQIVINPGFDLSDNNKAPWTGDGTIINDGASSAPNALSMLFNNGGGSNRIAQTLNSLDGNYRFSYRYSLVSVVNLGSGFSCSIQPQVGDVLLPSADPYDYSDWTPESHTWSSGGQTVAQADLSISLSCSGEYDQLTINLDDITFTRVCGPQAS